MLRMIAKVFATSVLVAGLSMGVHAQRQPERLSSRLRSVCLTEIQKLEHGQVVTKLLESGDQK